MEAHSKSLVLQYDSLVNSIMKCLDTTIENDYIQKLKVIAELINKSNEGENDKNTIKNELEVAQEECLKLSYKIKTSARLLDEVQVEKDKLIIENSTLKSQLHNLYNVFKKPNATETSQTRNSNSYYLDHTQRNKTKPLNNTEDLLSDLSYSYSEDSSYENAIKSNYDNHKLKSALAKRSSMSNILKDMNTKTCEINNGCVNDGKVIAITTVTVDFSKVNTKSILKTYPSSTSKALMSSSSDSVETVSSFSSTELESKLEDENPTNTEKEHTFVQKIIVIPEICGQCHEKIKFNNHMVKCVDCKTVAHLECKDLIPVVCTIDQGKIDALNCGIPPMIVHCISEIEKRGLNTVGIYRVSGSDKELKNLKENFLKGVPNLNDVDINVLCSYLKDYIRTQKNHIISQHNLSKLANALKDNGEVNEDFRQILTELPQTNRNILAFLILHLQKVASSPKCNMNYNCLAIVFGPTIIGHSSTCLDDLHIETEIICKVITELLKLPSEFWNNVLKSDKIISSDLLHSTPNRDQSPKSAHRFFSSGLKRRILLSPRSLKIAKVEFEKK